MNVMVDFDGDEHLPRQIAKVQEIIKVLKPRRMHLHVDLTVED